MLKQTIRCLVLILGMLSSAVGAYEAALIDINDSKVNVGQFLEYLEDTERQLDIGQVDTPATLKQFKDFEGKVFNAGYTSSVYWLHFAFEIDGPEAVAIKRYLEIDYALLGDLEIYQKNPDGGFKRVLSGVHNQKNEDMIHYSSYLYPIHLMTNERAEFFLKVSSYSSVTVPIYLWQTEVYLQKKSDLRIFFGILYGTLFAMCFYNLFLFFAMKQSCYLHYSCYVIALASIISAFNGITSQYLLSDLPWLSDRSSSVSGMVAIFFSCQFARGFLRLEDYSPKMDRVLNVFAWSMLAVIPLICSKFIRENYMSVAATIPLIWIVVSLWAGVLGMKHKVRDAKYFLIGWSFLLSSVLVFMLSLYNVLPYGVISEHGFQLGAVLEAIVFSYALADRTQIIQRERSLLQRSVLSISERSNKIKDEFLATISHEFRTPMNGVLGALEMLHTVKIPDEGLRYIEIANQSAADMMHIIDGILNFTEARSGSLRLKKTKFKHREMVDQIAWIYSRKFKAKGLSFRTEFSDSIDQVIDGDTDKIEQVLTQVLDNALKFTHQGGVVFEVTGSIDGETNKITINYVVSDSGVGISKDRVEQVYEAFRQQDSSNTRAYGGLGIGLAISRRLLELMGGNISFAENDGGGTVFEIVVVYDVFDIEIAKELPVEHVITDTIDSKASDVHHKILIVEDNSVNQMILKSMLKKMGYETLLAGNGREAVDLLEHEEVDAILMDCQMPVMDGYEATKVIRSGSNANSGKPILAVTANVMANDKEKCLNSGMDDYIKKPVTTKIVQQKLQHWLNN